jgi:hypothetical protein
MQLFLYFLVVFIFSVIRIAGVKTAAFQAFAHILFGLLIGLGIGKRDIIYYMLAVFLTIIELGCFIILA